MLKVRLYTRDGGFVHEGEIPDFTPTPEVIVWGERVFVRRAWEDNPSGTIYMEGLAWVLVPTLDLEEKDNGG
jgi:hypothetical protein